MPEQILTYYLKHRQIVEENLTAAKDPGNTEAIHDFRTSVKRIRVVARLTDRITDGAFDRTQGLRELNRLYKASGKLRDIQVTKYLLDNLHEHDLDPIAVVFNRRELKQRGKFELALEAFPWASLDQFEQMLSIAMKGYSMSQAESSAISLLEDFMHDISMLYHESRNEKRLHKVRTRLKDINYLSNIFDEQLPVEDYLHISPERLRELGEMAGLWHDHYNLESILEKYIIKDNNILHREALQEIKFRLKEKKEELYQEYCCILMNEMRI
ncbi:MAG TPA: CHAD domain-containing protein [Bacteroidales bacterium]|nr:CHAD domain-containing protein [Bacteroidales bacterium]